MVRPGGRAFHSLRPLACELSCLQNSDGSATFQSGATTVLASVHGPVSPRMPQHESIDAVVSVVVKSGPAHKTYEFEWEELLGNVLRRVIVTSSYPRTVIQVILQIVTADGSVLSTALHAAISALMDAGIEMTLLPTAVTCLVVTNDNDHGNGSHDPLDASGFSIRLDPSADEEQTSGGTVVLITSDDKLLACHTSHLEASIEAVLQCCTVAFRARPAITAFWRMVVEQKATRESQTLWSS